MLWRFVYIYYLIIVEFKWNISFLVRSQQRFDDLFIFLGINFIRYKEINKNNEDNEKLKHDREHE